MKPSFDLVIVVPIGPTCKLEFILDTLSSIQYYVHSGYKIVIADDSQNPACSCQLTQHFPDVVILKNGRNHGKQLGLYLTLSNAYRYALEHFDFPALLRLDTDALIIGHDPEVPILEFFKNNPTVGLAGCYITGLHSDQFGNNWDIGGIRAVYIAIAKWNTRFCLKHPIIYWRIRKHLYSALRHGYQFGEYVFGGTYVFSRIGLEKLRDNGLLPSRKFLGADLEEDHFFTMLIASVGLGFGDLASGDKPFACTWKSLPASPEVLYNAKKKITHSTRSWQNIQEDEIRKYFREKRVTV